MKKSLIIIGGLLYVSNLSLVAYDSIYDGTGSLVNAHHAYWGGDRDEARMHPHKDKTSTVTFQILNDSLKCSHIDIHSLYNLEQEVKINLKSWGDTTIQKSYQLKLPLESNEENNYKDGISIDMNNKFSDNKN